MSETLPVIADDDPLLESDFIKEMVRQIRALDTYGAYDDWPITRILKPFVLSKEEKLKVQVVGDPDEIVVSRVRAFYNAIATLIEKECGLMAVPMMSLTHEGFGRVIITVGKLVVLDKTLRDVHRFGFSSLSKMKDEADKLLSVALEIIGNYSNVAGL